MSVSKILIAAAMIGVASASCPNDCSGKGKCGEHDMCTCYPGYQGLDCSERTCLFGRAWGDVAYDEELAHDYAECSNNGICDRKTGECACNDGFSGDACRYSACPNGCNGHGTCEYISEIASDTSIQYQANSDRSYIDWDSGKSRFCKCDGGWSGVDCSSRMCPKGNDPLTTHTPDEVGGNTAEVQEVQTVQIQPHLYNDNNGHFVGLGGDFTLTYTDAYNQQWTTRPIRVATKIEESAADSDEIGVVGSTTTVTDSKRRFGIFELFDVIEFSGLQSGTTGDNGPVKTITAIACGPSDATCSLTVTPAFASTEAVDLADSTISITLVSADTGEIGVKRMLLELPNQVIPDLVVDETIGVDKNEYRITFSDAANSGDQHSLQCKVASCDTDGCQPRKKAIKGIYQVKVSDGVVSGTNAVSSDSGTLNNFQAGVMAVGAKSGTATSATATSISFSGTTLSNQASGSLTMNQIQDFTDDSVGEVPAVNSDFNTNAFTLSAGAGAKLTATSSNQVNQLADASGGIGSHYTLTVADSDATNTALSWSSNTLVVGGTGSFTAAPFLSSSGRAIQAGDSITISCAGSNLADGTYTVTSVTAYDGSNAGSSNIAVSETVADATADDGECVIHVTMGSLTTGYTGNSLTAGDRVSVKCTDTYTVSIADADAGETALEYVATAGATGQHMLLTTSDSSTFAGANTAVTMLDGGAVGGRAITAGDSVTISCAGASLAVEDGTYTVDSVTNTQIFLSGRTIAAAVAADGACTFKVTPSGDAVRISTNDGFYNIDSVSGTAITFDRAITAPTSTLSSTSCVVKKIRDSPCTVVETRKGTSENYECSRRGNCDSQTGLCACFAGYTGEDCSVQTVLV